jgi:uncharacterized membrane protein
MARIEKDITVDVPVSTAYNQWTQFEEYPQFMEGVQSVEQLDDQRLHWTATVAGKSKEWYSRITEQVPDKRIVWTSEGGTYTSGMVDFLPANGSGATRVHVAMEYDPEGIVEDVGDKLGFVSRQVEGDLKRFKEFIETRGQETGAWRGTIARPS